MKESNASKIRRLRLRIKELEAEVDGIKQDRKKFRDHFSRRFRWWIELVGKNSNPNKAWLIEDDAKFLKEVDWWIW